MVPFLKSSLLAATQVSLFGTIHEDGNRAIYINDILVADLQAQLGKHTALKNRMMVRTGGFKCKPHYLKMFNLLNVATKER